MPLTPLPASNTKRFWLVQTFGPYEHRTLFRSSDDYPNTDARTLLQAVFDAVAGGFYSNWSATGLEVAEVGSDIRNPVSGWTLVTGTNAIGAASGQQLVVSNSFRGRSISGRKVKWLFFGVVSGDPDDFEWTAAADTDMDALRDFLDGQPDFALCIDHSKPVVKTNILFDYNDHWEKEARP